MRDKERELTKKEGVTRILVLGDSFTAGLGVEQNQTYSSILENILNEQGKNVEVWNAGVDGYSTDVHYLQLKNSIDTIKPDIVLLGFYIGNDLIDISRNLWISDNRGLPTQVSSPVARVQNNQLRILEDEENPYKATLSLYADMILFRISHFYSHIKRLKSGTLYIDRESPPMFLKEESQLINENWKKLENLFIEIKNVSSNHKSEFLIILIPPRLQVNNREWEVIEKEYVKYSPMRNHPQEKLLAICKKNKIPCIDLFPILTNSTEKLYHELTDMHFTPKGHRKTAEHLAKELSLR